MTGRQERLVPDTGRPDRGIDHASALYEVTVSHRRAQTVADAFTHRIVLWLVDLDDLPSFPGIAFRAADHLGHPDRPIRENLDAFLAARGRPRPARVLMLAHPRTLGYVFNPITLYWCHDADGALREVVAEVHSTTPTAAGTTTCSTSTTPAGPGSTRSSTSPPFFRVEGEYRMRVPEPGETLAATVVLRRPDAEGRLTTAFVATLRGRRHPAIRATAVRALLRHPLVTQRVSLAIRRRGVALWARGVPVVPRTAVDVEPGLGQFAPRGAESAA